MLEVVAPGFLSTIQDGGRPSAASRGVPSSGACDRRSLAIANALLGNAPFDAALEITLAGPELMARETTVIGLAGADLGARVADEGRQLRPGASHLVRAGQRIVFEAREGSGGGCRAYLALPGGIQAPRFLGSASTYLPAAFGGLEGRPLRAGDRLAGRRWATAAEAGRHWPEPRGSGVAGLPGENRGDAVVLRIVAGPHADRLVGGVGALCAEPWEVTPSSDRIGLRLTGPAAVLAATGSAQGDDLVSIALPWGAVQVPPDGLPIVLLADHQTVGGYPVPAVVATVDHPVAGQLSPGDRVVFELVDAPAAQLAYRRERLAMATALASLEIDGGWAVLAESAEG